jgi:excisionase family DNA binding protein
MTTQCGGRSDVALALRPREAARALGVCGKTLWSWTKAGIVPHVRIGKAVLYPVDLLQEWLRQQAARQQAETAELVEGQGNGAVQ